MATLAVRVPVNATGNLADGAARIVERVATVDRVEGPDVLGLTPGLNDTIVDVRVRIAFAADFDLRSESDSDSASDGGERGDDAAAARRELENGTGVQRVDAIEPETMGDGRRRVRRAPEPPSRANQ